MAKRPPIGDPRKLGGDLAGPGGPNERNSVIVDTRNAVLLDGVDVALVELRRAGQPVGELPDLALKLSGRINKTSDRAEVLYLFGEDGAAAIVSELVGLAVRIGPAFTERLRGRLDAVLGVSEPGDD